MQQTIHRAERAHLSTQSTGLTMVYSVYFIDIAGCQNVDCAYVSKTEALSAIDRLLNGPGRMVVKEIKCVDALDRLVWHCRDGIVWPDEPDSTQLNQPTSHQETT